MAVKNAVEYAIQAQAAEKNQIQESRKASETKQKRMEAVTFRPATENGKAAADTQSEEGVRYDVSERTNEVAAWYQEYLRREQEEKLGLALTEEEEAEKEEKDPVREAQEKAERILQSLQQMLERMREQQKKQKEQKKKAKSKLSYNYRKVSSSISSAKTSTQASNALSSATANLSLVRRQAVSGKYEEREIQLALQHAQKMVRAARKKVANLKSEAQQAKRNRAKENHKKQRNSIVHRVPDRQKVEKELQQLKQELKSRENIEKNRNRRDEDMDLLQADMQYLRRRIDLLKNHGLSLSTENQRIVDDMVAAAMGLVSVDLKEEAVEAAQGGQTTETVAAETAGTETAEVAASSSFDTSI